MYEKISQKLVGCRVKAAREAKHWSQNELASKLSIKDRQTISDIENGKRSLRPDELMAISDLLEQDVDYFINPFAIVGEAQFSWRARATVSENTLADFEHKAGQWIGLLRWLREIRDKQPSVLQKRLCLPVRATYEDAQKCAESLVSELNLGEIPTESLIDRIESELDIPVLFVDTVEIHDDKSISGATCHLNELSVILINRHESEGRRFYDLAHELFHALTWNKNKPDHQESNAIGNQKKGKRTEQLADNFASSLLMPQATLDKLIVNYRDISHLYEAAKKLKVAPVALAWRLFNLGLIDGESRRVLSEQKQPPTVSKIPKRFSHSFVNMLHAALQNGQLSARKAAKAIGLELIELNKLFTEHELPTPYDL